MRKHFEVLETWQGRWVTQKGPLSGFMCRHWSLGSERIGSGTNRRSHFKTLKKLWRWAVQSGRVDVDPMSKLRPADEWGVNAEHLSIAFYHRLLRVVAGKESPSKSLDPTTKYQFLL